MSHLDNRRRPKVERLDVRVWDRIEEEGEHWIWTGALGRDHNYPQLVITNRDFEEFDISGRFGLKPFNEPRLVPARRVMWGLEVGNVPYDKLVIRRCDASACVRPIHMFLGDPIHVIEQEKRRNPMVRRGLNNTSTKLTEKLVWAIWEAIEEDDQSYAEIAEDFNVDPGTVSNIARGASWQHVTGLVNPTIMINARRAYQARRKPGRFRRTSID